MVARIITGKSIRGALSYNEQKVREGQAELLFAGRFLREPALLTFDDKLRRFEQLQEKAPHVKTNAVHISLNFDLQEVLPPARLIQIATSYMERIGFGEQPFLLYRHLDAAHPHLHIVTTCITPGGQRINLHNIGREKSEPARKALELEFGLVQADSKKQTLSPPQHLAVEPALYGKTATKKAITAIVSYVTRHYNYTSLAELNAALRSFGVTADRGSENSLMHRNKGLIYYLADAQGNKAGIPIKASALYGKPTLAALEKRFIQNSHSRKTFRPAIRQHIDQALQQARQYGAAAFTRYLHQVDTQVLFRENAQGTVFGVTFVDHHHKVVIKGSELGKGYSAASLLTRLSDGRPAAVQQPEAYATAKGQEQTGTGSAAGALDTSLLRVLQASPTYDYLPRELRRGRRKRKKRNPHL